VIHVYARGRGDRLIDGLALPFHVCSVVTFFEVGRNEISQSFKFNLPDGGRKRLSPSGSQTYKFEMDSNFDSGPIRHSIQVANRV